MRTSLQKGKGVLDQNQSLQHRLEKGRKSEFRGGPKRKRTHATFCKEKKRIKDSSGSLPGRKRPEKKVKGDGWGEKSAEFREKKKETGEGEIKFQGFGEKSQRR